MSLRRSSFVLLGFSLLAAVTVACGGSCPPPASNAAPPAATADRAPEPQDTLARNVCSSAGGTCIPRVSDVVCKAQISASCATDEICCVH
jgi:hypothetical protein